MEVILSKQAEKDLSKAPSFILRKVHFWVGYYRNWIRRDKEI